DLSGDLLVRVLDFLASPEISQTLRLSAARLGITIADNTCDIESATRIHALTVDITPQTRTESAALATVRMIFASMQGDAREGILNALQLLGYARNHHVKSDAARMMRLAANGLYRCGELEEAIRACRE